MSRYRRAPRLMISAKPFPSGDIQNFIQISLTASDAALYTELKKPVIALVTGATA